MPNRTVTWERIADLRAGPAAAALQIDPARLPPAPNFRSATRGASTALAAAGRGADTERVPNFCRLSVLQLVTLLAGFASC